MRAMTVGLTLCSALLASNAEAKEPYMWGFGPRIGTIGIPGAYPLAFPPKIAKYDLDGDGETDLNGNGDPITTSLSRSRWEGILGGEGVYYLDKENRVGGVGGVTLGKRFWAVDLIAKYDRALSTGQIDILGGAGVGVGYMRFGGDVGEESLKVSYYPLRAALAAQYRIETAAFQLALAGQFNVPARHNYTSQAGIPVDVSAPLNYLQLNLELTAMFGDFEPPKKKKRRNTGARSGNKPGGNKPGAKGGSGGNKGGGAKPKPRRAQP